MALEVGVKAPACKALADDSSVWSVRNHKGSWLVLYFYPKDDTTACTAQACDVRDNMKALTKLSVHVVGVSPDSLKRHASFKGKYDLNFTLVSDEEKSVCEAYDTWKQKSMYGRTYMGVVRTTYIINPKGVIAAVFDKVKVKDHVSEVIATLKHLM